MAFPLPAHLPRKKHPQDVSSALLSTISETSVKTLNAELAASWVAELDESIQLSKIAIHERVQEDPMLFDSQLVSAKSVQTRLRSLEANVDELSSGLSNPETGLAPRLIRTLAEHSSLAQSALNAEVIHRTLAHLLQCRNKLNEFSGLVSGGELPQAVAVSGELAKLLGEAPPPLGDAEVMKGLKRQYRAMRDRAEEQLSEAYTRAVAVTPGVLIIRPNVQVRQSSNLIPFPSILSSLSHNSLADHLTTFRRDITTHYIDYVLNQPLSVTLDSLVDGSGIPQQRLQVYPAAPDSDSLTGRINNLSIILKFLDTHIFSALPHSEKRNFLKSLSKPLTKGLLNHLLIPRLPSSLSSLPSYLELVATAVRFEEEELFKILKVTGEAEIRSWTDGVVSHYEKKRRIDILDRCRQALVQPQDANATFRAEASDPPSKAVQEDPASEPPTANVNGIEIVKDEPSLEPVEVDEDGWGFEDEGAAPEADVVEDAWGWNDETSPVEIGQGDEPAWDAWDDPPPPSNGKTLKVAKRLEKLSSKTNLKTAHSNGASILAKRPPSPINTSGKPPEPPSHPLPVVKEFYLVSSLTKEITAMVEGVLREGEELSRSKLFSSFPTPSLPPGTLILQTAPSLLDLFRLLYPVTFASELAKSPERPLRFSNDCLYLSEEIRRISRQSTLDQGTKDKLNECQEKLEVFGQSWFEQTIDQQIASLDKILDPTQGFVDTGDQEQFDVCEAAVNEVLQTIKRVSQKWKGTLTRTRHLTAIGLVINAVLSRILEEITALPDITAAESHKLSELCRIFNALEGLFVDDPEQPSLVVVYVPSWLKFSYLSELLEASMADINYLFDEGALVDFEIDELVKLVQALFADTPLRTTTINKIQGVPSHQH